MTKENKKPGNAAGTIWIHKGDASKRVKPNELDYYLANGWVSKRTQSFCDTMKVRVNEYYGSMTPEERKALPNNYWAWKSPEELEEIKKRDVENHAIAWANQTPEKKREIGKKHTDAYNRLSDEEKKAIVDKRNNTINSNPDKKAAVNKRRSETLKNKSSEEKGIWVSKIWLTKKKNGTTNTSKPEQMLYEKLLKEYDGKTIYREYKCDRYPYHCDFYIVEDDLFIELNAHWTHGGRPYDPNDFSCQKQLELWQEKAKDSKYMQSAIETWTIRDVEKAACAKKNNLNYWVIY